MKLSEISLSSIAMELVMLIMGRAHRRKSFAYLTMKHLEMLLEVPGP
jgi:hypothetical protein